jgi:myo-inositol-1(or 4)-monophosphatase
MVICKEAAIAGGTAIRSRPTEQKIQTKAENIGRVHCIVTESDLKSQSIVLEIIKRADPAAGLITEEKGETCPGDYLTMPGSNGCYIIDPLDGTSTYASGLYEWSVSVGFVDKNLKHTAGAIFAPEIYNGTLFYGSSSNGSFMEDIGSRFKTRIKVRSTTKLKGAYILVGPDCLLPNYPAHNKLVLGLAKSARTTNISGSCALALGLVAAGKADALVQPLLSPWDYAAGRCIVEQAGGIHIFYEIKDNRIILVENLEPRHYNPEERAVGFVAGNRAIAEQIIEKLLRIEN